MVDAAREEDPKSADECRMNPRGGHFWVRYGMTGNQVTCVHCEAIAPKGTPISEPRWRRE